MVLLDLDAPQGMLPFVRPPPQAPQRPRNLLIDNLNLSDLRSPYAVHKMYQSRGTSILPEASSCPVPYASFSTINAGRKFQSGERPASTGSLLPSTMNAKAAASSILDSWKLHASVDLGIDDNMLPSRQDAPPIVATTNVSPALSRRPGRAVCEGDGQVGPLRFSAPEWWTAPVNVQAAANHFDAQYQKHVVRCKRVLLASSQDKTSMSKASALGYANIELRRTRYVAPNMQPHTDGVTLRLRQRKQQQHVVVAKPKFDLRKSIWAPRVQWSDARDLLDGTEVARDRKSVV